MIFNFNNFILLYGAADQIGNIVGQFMIHLLITLFMICLYAKYISIPNGNIGFFLYFKNIKYGNIFQISIFFLIFSILIIFFYHTRFDTGIILSIRNYIFGIPCIYLGYKLFNNEITFNDKLLVYFVIFCFFVALIQFIFVYQYGVASLDSLPFQSKEHLGHSYYDTIYYTANSVFNSAKEYSYFILFFGMLILSKLSKYSRKNLILLILILFFSLILSGSRTVIILFSMTVFIYLNIFKVRLISKLYLYLLLFMLMSTIIILLANNFIVLNYLVFYFNVTYY